MLPFWLRKTAERLTAALRVPGRSGRQCRRGFSLEHLEDRTVPAAVITVNSTADANLRDGALTLQEAILISNRALNVAALTTAEKAQVSGTPNGSSADTIAFNIPTGDARHVYYRDDGTAGRVAPANVTATTATSDGAIADIDPDWAHSWYSIELSGPLPDVTETVVIDGTTQSGTNPNTNPVGQGLNSVLRVEVTGVNVSDMFPALMRFEDGSENSTMRGLVLNRAKTAIGFVPVLALEREPGGVHVEGSYVGTDVSGTINFNDFVRVRSSNNVIGGTSAAARNLILTIVINQSSNLDNRIEGNLIGVDRSGTQGIGGGISDFGTGTVIGGSNPAAGNVIAGVSLDGSGALLQNNRIGTDVTGTADASTAQNGVGVGGNDNMITGNTIAFNGRVDGGGNVLGGGIAVTGNRNQITHNSVFSNLGTGVTVGSTGKGNRISENSIYDNGLLGINLVSPGDNATGGVTLNDVPPASDPPDQDTGPNQLQNFPVISSVVNQGGNTRIAGTLTSTPNSSFRLEFFASAERDDTAGGAVAEGQTFLGGLDVTTDAGGVAGFDSTFAALPSGQPYVTATATDVTDPGSGRRNNTSEFSTVFTVGGPSFVVTSTTDSGLGSLREAILNANLTPGAQTITFAIPVTDPRHFYYRDDGVAGEVTFENTTVTTAANDSLIADIDPDWTHSWFGIILDSELPVITDTITIDGYSQAGATPNTLPFPQGLDTVLKIELDGRNVGGDGLTLGFTADGQGKISDGGGSVIRGLAINAFGGDGIRVQTLGGGNTIAGNFVGPDISGTINFGNGGNGMFLVVEQTTSIGGANAADRNLIAGNVGNGIEVLRGNRNLVVGNMLQSDRHGRVFFASPGAAVFISADDREAQASSIVVALNPGPIASPPGFTDDGLAVGVDSNWFEMGAGFGVYYRVAASKGFAGPDKIGMIWLRQVHQARTELVKEAQQKSIRSQPSLYSAGIQTDPMVVGIDLDDDGITPNDPGDLDDGPNGLQNYPVMTSATTVNSTTTVTGTLNSLANTSFHIEVYSSSYDTNLFRAGEQSLGTVDVTTDANGNASFTFVSPVVVPAGHHVIALATRLEDLDSDSSTPLEPVATSEFSAGIVVSGTATTGVAATQTDALLVDTNHNGGVDAGDTLRYTVTLSNTGATAAQAVQYVADLDANTALVDGSVTTTQGDSVSGTYNLAVNVGTIPAGGSVTITFDVVVKDPLPDGVTRLTNQGTVSGSNFLAVATDDPDTPAAGDPTVTTLGTPAVQVTGVLVNGTTAPATNVTRSRLTSLVVNFNTPVTSLAPGAFTLTRGATTLTSGGAIAVAGLGTTTLTLTFTGTTGVEFGSLADGIWTLTTDLTKVHAGATTGTGTSVTGNVRRLFGDGNSDGTVTLTDFGLFGSTFGKGSASPGFNAAFDWNNDGSITLTDFGAFGNRFGKGL